MNFNHLVHLDRMAVEALDRAAKTCAGQHEEGGIFLGSHRGPHVEVTGLTTLGSSDVRRRYAFIRQDPKHQRAADQAWRASGGTITFVGEWHTHPLGDATPSTTDTASWSLLVKKGKRPMCFVIVAPGHWRTFFVVPGVWRPRIVECGQPTEGRAGRTFPWTLGHKSM